MKKLLKLDLKRTIKTEKSTIGELYVDGKLFCFTLEDPVRADGIKIDGDTAIPAGVYTVVVSFSNRFQKLLPELLNVKGFSGVRIHKGNSPKDTQGCVLVGMKAGRDYIEESGKAFDALFPLIQDAEKVILTIQ